MEASKAKTKAAKRRGGDDREGVSHAALAAAIISGGLGLVGVWNLVGDGIGRGNVYAMIAGALMAGVIAVAESYALMMLVQADKRRAEGAAAQRWAAVAIYGVAELVNCAAGAYGVMTINERLIAAQREPIEARFAAAAAAEQAAGDAVAHFDAQTNDILRSFDDDLRGAREGAAMAVTARRGTLGARAEAAAERERARGAPCETTEQCVNGGPVAQQTRARAERAAAALELAAAPKGMSLIQELAVAFALLLFKGPGVWASAPGRRGDRPASAAAAKPVVQNQSWGKKARIDLAAAVEAATRDTIRAMDQSARTALHKQAKRVAAWCQHAGGGDLAAA